MTITELEERLQADLPRLADVLTGAHAEPVDLAVSSVHQPRHRRVGRLVAAAIAAAMVAALVVSVVAIRGGGDDAREPAVVASGATATVLPPSPLGPRAGVAAVWTGSEVLVYGGYRGSGIPLALQSGAAYDPATGSWRSIADNHWAHPGALATWAGDRMVVLAKNGGAEYLPATDSWRDLPRLPDSGGGSFRGVVWTGDEVLGLVRGSQTVAVARLDRDAQTWSVGPVEALIPATSTATDSVVWTGDELVYWSGGIEGAAYRPSTGRWRALPPLPGDARAEPSGALVEAPAEHAGLRSAVAVVDGVVVVAYLRDEGDGMTVGVARLVDDAWTVVVELPATPFGEPFPIVAGGALIVLDGTGVGAPVQVDLGAGSAGTLDGSALRAGAGTTGVWTGGGLFVWGGLPAGTPASFANPAPDAPDAAWIPVQGR